MDENTVIEFNHVSKKFCKDLNHVLKYGSLDISKTLIGIDNFSKLREFEFWALNDISLEIKRGEAIGIIGANGSGKTTLLKLLNGIFLPEKGSITVKGKVGALIAVGAGFHPILTGRENIYVNGAILGMSKKAIDDRFNKIVDFADIGDFLDTPVKNYSSGMYVRLGFSIAVHCLPDILLVDEVLSVGDASFQKKSMAKMYQIAQSDRVVVFVSHNMEAVSSFTKKAIYLRNGRIRAIGPTDEVIEKYIADEKNFKKTTKHSVKGE